MSSAFGELIVIRPSQGNYSERHVWQTDILEFTEGGENREELLEAFIYTSSIDIRAMNAVVRQFMDAIILYGMENEVVVPLWFSESAFTSVPASTALAVLDVDDMEFVAGRLVCAMNPAGEFDVRTIVSASGTTVEIDSPLTETYSVGDPVLPCFRGYMPSKPTESALSDRFSQISLSVVEL